MTDQTNGPSGESQETTAPAPIADTNAPATASAEDTSETWASGLSEDNRSYVEKKNWKSPDDALNSQRELEKMVGKSLRLPDDKASDEDWKAFYDKLGRPEKPEGYEFSLNAETVPEDFPYDESSANEFKNWSHDSGLNPKQAQKLHDKYVAFQANAFKAAKEEQQKREEDAHREIVRKWGAPDSDGFKTNLNTASRAITELGLKDAFVQGGLVSSDGAIKNPIIADAMLKVGQELYSEDTGTAPGQPSQKETEIADRWYGGSTPKSRG